MSNVWWCRARSEEKLSGAPRSVPWLVSAWLLLVGSVSVVALPAGVVGGAGADAAVVVGVGPVRVADTRFGAEVVDGGFVGSGPLAAGAVLEVPVAGRVGVPSDAAAVVANVTVIAVDADGWVVAYGCGAMPETSSVNVQAGVAVASEVVAALSASGSLCVSGSTVVEVLVDVVGYVPSGSGYEGVDLMRLADTRVGFVSTDGVFRGLGGFAAFEVWELPVAGRAGVPEGAAAAVLNVTSTRAVDDGWAVVFPCGASVPEASSLNFRAGVDVANEVVAPLSPDGSVCLMASAATDLIVDVAGFVPAGVGYGPVVPFRLADTRAGTVSVDGRFVGSGPVPAGGVVRVPVSGRAGIPDAAGLVVVNVTAVGAADAGYVTVFPCTGEVPYVSAVNFWPEEARANEVFAQLSAEGDLCVYTSVDVEVIVDVVGFVDGPRAPPATVPHAPTPPSTPAPDPDPPTEVPVGDPEVEVDVPWESPEVQRPTAGVFTGRLRATPTAAGDVVSVWATEPEHVGRRFAVEVLPEAVVDQVGFQQAGFGLWVEGGPREVIPVGTRIDYDGFRWGLGAGWDDRLGVVSTGGCSWTSVSGWCDDEFVDVDTVVNDVAAGTIEVVVDTFGTPLGGGPFGSTRPWSPPWPGSGSAAGGAVLSGVWPGSGSAAGVGAVFGLFAQVSGSAGDLGASPLSPSASWSHGGSSGGFGWSYPLGLPELGLAPQVSPGLGVSYQSQRVDGMTSVTSSQAGSLGLGWSLDAGGFIERSYRSCPGTRDLCWDGHNAALVVAGVSSRLVPVNADHSEWRLEDDNGWRVQRLTGAPEGPGGDGLVDDDGEYWLVTTTDGVTYRFGFPYEGTAADPKTALATNSVWTVPVYGGPCAGSGWCQQGWRWMLDRVEDPVGNVASYTWAPEFNWYARGGQRWSPTRYVRGGELAGVGWVKRSGAEQVEPGMRVDVMSEPRCAALAANCVWPPTGQSGPRHEYPDVPTDLWCSGSERCDQLSPSFWSSQRVREVRATSAGEVLDAWRFTHEFPWADGDPVKLWLRSIQRTATPSAGPVLFPSVRFEAVDALLANRWDSNPAAGVGAMRMYRMNVVRDELGGEVRVGYTQPDPCAGMPSAGWANNTSNCYPAWWSPGPGRPGGWAVFNTWVVGSVTHGALAASASWASANGPYLSTPVTTTYTYHGGGGWAHDRRAGVPLAVQSWGQWRGYARVTARVDSGADGAVETETRYFRGLHGDRNAAGGTKTVNVSASTGLADATPFTAVDHRWLAGRVLESRTIGAAGELAGGITVWDETNVATGVAPGGPGGGYVPPPLQARVVYGSQVWSRIADASGVHAHVSATHTTVNDAGFPVSVFETGDTLTHPAAGNTRCTRTTYQSPGNDNMWRPIRISGYAGGDPAGCGGAEVARTVYDWDAAGRLTEQRVHTAAGSAVTSTVGYGGDVFGRPTSTRDPNGNTTTIAYLHDGVTAASSTVRVTNPLGDQVTARVDRRGELVRVTHPNGSRTRIDRDRAGRVTSVWGPTEPDSGPATLRHSYVLPTNNTAENYRHGPNRITTTRLVRAPGDPGGQATVVDVAYVDGLGRQVESHTQTPEGRVVSAVRFDGAGRPNRTLAPQAYGGSPTAGMVNTATGVLETRTGHDALGRVVSAAEYVNGVAQPATTTTYAGLSSTVTPPVGGPTTTTTDAYGNTVLVQEPAPGITARSRFDTRGLLVGVGAVTGHRPFGPITGGTEFGYDWAGRRITMSDPDAGAWTYGYDGNSNLTSSVDGNGQQLVTVFDAVDRPVTRTATGVGTVASWSYHSAGAGRGLVHTATSHQHDGTYTDSIGSYDVAGRPLSRTWTTPHTDPYTESSTWTRAGQPATVTFGAAGAAAAETVTYGYDTLGRPTTVTGSETYVSATGYDPLGRVASRTLGVGAGAVMRGYGFDARHRLETLTATAGGVTAQHDVYHYDDGSRITAIDHHAGPAHRQCFDYDAVNRLIRASTRAAGSGCGGPAVVAGLGDGVGYDTRWEHRADGAMLAQHSTTTDGVARESFGAAGVGHRPVVFGRDDTAIEFVYDNNGDRVGHVDAYTEPARLVTVNPPVRVLSTRDDPGETVVAAGATRHVHIPGLDPDATAVMVSITTVDADTDGGLHVGRDAGSLSAVPQVPISSAADQATSNLVTVPVTDTGFVMSATASTHVMVDLVAVYVAVPGAVEAGRVVMVDPERVFDTRGLNAPALGEGERRAVNVTGVLPDDAVGVIATVTAVSDPDLAGHDAPGWIAVVPHDPAGGVPATSTLNVGHGLTGRATQVTVVVDTIDGLIDVYSSVDRHVVIDVVGYITGTTSPASGAGLFQTIRQSQLVFDATVTGTETVGVAGRGGAPTTMSAAVVQLGFAPDEAGFAAIDQAGAVTDTSNANAAAGEHVVAHATTRVSTGGDVDVTTSTTAGVTVEIVGWYTDTYPNDTVDLEPVALTWDPQRRLRTTTNDAGEVTGYSYNTGAQRIGLHHPDGSRSIYTGHTQLDIDTAGQMSIRRNITTGDGAQIAVVNIDTTGERTTSWMIGDHHGTVTATITGGTIDRRWYTPYGAPRGAPAAGWPTTTGYLNQHEDPATTLTYLNHRYHQPSVAGFISPDPIAHPRIPQSLNRYTYSRNNPINMSDPDGLAPGYHDQRDGSGTTFHRGCDYQCQQDAFSKPKRSRGWSLPFTLNQAAAFAVGFVVAAGCYAAGTAGAAATAGTSVAAAAATCSAAGGAVARGVETYLAGGSATEVINNAGNPTSVAADSLLGGLFGSVARPSIRPGVSQLTPPAIGPAGNPGAFTSPINLTTKGTFHVLARHFPGGTKTAGKSIFNSGESIPDLVAVSQRVAPATQANTNLVRIVDAGRVVGTDVATGQPTSIYTVVTTWTGDLVTMYPGFP